MKKTIKKWKREVKENPWLYVAITAVVVAFVMAVVLVYINFEGGSQVDIDWDMKAKDMTLRHVTLLMIIHAVLSHSSKK
jgi:succinate dehydrogenase hydrophobic anchor subunit